MIVVIFCIPAFWNKKKKYGVLKYFSITLFLSLLFSSAVVFFPYKSYSPSFEIEPERFYTSSNKNIIFVDKTQESGLSGVIIGEKAETYSGRYSVSENMMLELQGNNDKYVVEKPNPYHKFFTFFIKISSFMVENISKNGADGKTEKSVLKEIFIKSFAIIIAISTISFFFSTGKWPLINYLFSQTLVICFIWFNNYIPQIPFPQFLQGVLHEAENLIPFNFGIYYFAYIVISLSILLIKILSNRARKCWICRLTS